MGGPSLPTGRVMSSSQLICAPTLVCAPVSLPKLHRFTRNIKIFGRSVKIVVTAHVCFALQYQHPRSTCSPKYLRIELVIDLAKGIVKNSLRRYRYLARY